ncbi:MAG: hypothetical protein Q9160_003774 [Pyrenula sp. 1 TL-2023]
MGQKRKNDISDQTKASSLGLSAPTASFDPALSSLFASTSGPVKPKVVKRNDQSSPKPSRAPRDPTPDTTNTDASEHSTSSDDHSPQPSDLVTCLDGRHDSGLPSRKRRKVHPSDDLEARYLDRLSREEETRQAHLQPNEPGPERTPSLEDIGSEASSAGDVKVPLHETLSGEVKDDASLKNKRTVFLGNVSTTAIKSKSAKKTLLQHLSSFLPSLPSETGPHTFESIRFRSVAFSSSIPRKAAYAKKELMDETTKATNAYAIYSTEAAVRKCVKHLNGTVVLDRHLRADLVAHPSKIEHRRCIFVGNLSFVDEESHENNDEDPNSERRKRGKEPADAEEGLWRIFSKCGTVESVRVIRDPSTRVGKGFAYVQFTDENAVEAALLYNDKKFPPMLPRKLRVMRAKSVKRKDMKRDGRKGDQRSKGPARSNNFSSKVSKPARGGPPRGQKQSIEGGIRKPESFVFEGHRASKAKDRVPGSKLKAKSAKKPQNRSTKRAAAYRAAGRNGKTGS